jgi:predicted alpha-1,6-mannanase (GH76 family)
MLKPSCLALTLLLACGPTSDESAGSTDDALASSSRADDATTHLLGRFWDGGQHYLRATDPGDGRDAGYWIFAQAFDAVVDGAQRTHGAKFKGDIAVLYDAQDARGWRRDWFDDENWMALALIRAYDVTREQRYLDRAEALFADIEAEGRTAEGIWWDRKHTQKATASNFGPAITAARLNERTGKPEYKAAAREIYDYWYSSMVDHTAGKVADHRDSNGTVDWRRFTYNTGLAIGASIEVWVITSEHGYLSHAYQLGSAMIHDEVVSTPFGDVLHDEQCTGDCDAFKGIAFRYLAKLFALDRTQSQYGSVLHASAKAIWSSARNAREGTFASDWSDGARASTTLAADASAVIALNLAAEDGL